MGFEIESMAIEMPEVAKHPNRVAFRGVLTFVDVPSDSAPSGARGHRVMLKRVATERAIPSLLGMGLDYTPSLDRHDARRKVGVITQADIKADKDVRPTQALAVGGFLYARDFPELVQEIRAKGPKVLGMSYEIAEAKIDDVAADVWAVSDFSFTGAAVLRRDKAAYKQTWIELQ
ncbi:MAG: hypothetical protein ACXVZV_15755 [Terriglobales bacterium]